MQPRSARACGLALALSLSLVSCGDSNQGPRVHPGLGSSTGTTETSASAAGGGESSGTGIEPAAPDAAGAAGTQAQDVTALPWRGPVPPEPGARFPFPQNRQTPHCSYPADYRNEDVVTAYERWKADVVTSEGAGGHLRIQRLETDPALELHTKY